MELAEAVLLLCNMLQQSNWLGLETKTWSGEATQNVLITLLPGMLELP